VARKIQTGLNDARRMAERKNVNNYGGNSTKYCCYIYVLRQKFKSKLTKLCYRDIIYQTGLNNGSNEMTKGSVPAQLDNSWVRRMHCYKMQQHL